MVFAHETRIPSTKDELLKLDRHSATSDAGRKKGGVVCIDEIGELTCADFDTFLQTKFLDREKMMTREELTNLAADLPREHVEEPHRRVDDASSQGHWFDISDNSVSEIDFGKVLKKQAYLLFYDKIF